MNTAVFICLSYFRIDSVYEYVQRRQQQMAVGGVYDSVSIVVSIFSGSYLYIQDHLHCQAVLIGVLSS
jgi:hypothetical protein